MATASDSGSSRFYSNELQVAAEERENEIEQNIATIVIFLTTLKYDSMQTIDSHAVEVLGFDLVSVSHSHSFIIDIVIYLKRIRK